MESPDMGERTALLFGASGLTGGHCLRYLLADDHYTKVVAPGRRLLDIEHPKLEQPLVDFDRLDGFVEALKGDDVFCCLGTTIRKAGSREAFQTVDFVYPSRIAELSHRNGAVQFLMVSAMGADPKSPIFYSRVKGEVEQAIRNYGYPALTFFRPSLLLGKRQEKRVGEDIGQWLYRFFPFIFRGPLAKYKPVNARAVAFAMVKVAKEYMPGENIIESAMISDLYRQSGER